MWSNFGKSVELERVLYVPVQHGHPSFYSNNVFYEAVDVLRFSGSGIVPSERWGGCVCGGDRGYLKACKVQQC